MNSSPVMQALTNAKRQEQIESWEKQEAALRASLGILGDSHAQPTAPEAITALTSFKNWCVAKGVRHCPAKPATLAAFVLDHASLGLEALSEVVEHIASAHDAFGFPNPVTTWIVNAAMDRVGQVEPPRSWPKEYKARFARLPVTLQRYVAAREEQRDKAIRRAQNEAADARKQLEKANESQIVA